MHKPTQIYLQKSLVLIYLILSVIIGCSEKKKTKDKNDQYTVTPTGRIRTIPIDQETTNISDAMFNTNDNQLYYFNTPMNEIQIYDLEKRQLLTKNRFDVDGEQGVGHISGFYIHNNDSIFIFPRSKPYVYLTTSTGEVVKRIEYIIPNGHTSAFVSSGSIQYSDVNKLIVCTHVDGNYNYLTAEDLASKQLSYTIDLTTGETNLLPHYYPSDYWSENKKDFSFQMAYSNDKTVYSFFADHHIYVADRSGLKLKRKHGKSDYLASSFEPIPIKGSRNDRFRYFSGSQHYGKIIHDEYRKLYYRFAYPKTEIQNVEDYSNLRIYPKSFSILIFDQNGDIVGETLFENNKKYVPYNVFINYEGLNISVNHAENPEASEDAISFELLEIKGKI